MEIEKPHGSSVDMRKNLSGIVNYEKQHNFMPNNGSNIYTHHQNQNYNMGDYNNQQQLPYNNQYNNEYNQPQSNQQNPLFKTNNFFSNNQQNNNYPVQPNSSRSAQHQQMPNRQPNQPINYPNNIQNMQNPYNQQGFRPQQSFEENRTNIFNKPNIIEQQPQINYQSWNQMVDAITNTRDPRFKD